MNEMATRIRELRLEKDWTQEQLGEKVGLQKSAIAKYENGRTENMKRSVIQSMAEVFGVSPSYLMGFTDRRVLVDSNHYIKLLNDRPELCELLDATNGMSKEDVELVIKLMEKM